MSACLFLLVGLHPVLAVGPLPHEPIEIGTTPQFVMDGYVVDNYWSLKYKRQAIHRVFHSAVKHPANPLFAKEDASFLWVVRDVPNGIFRMWYRDNILLPGVVEGRKYQTHIAYAQSKDGVHWSKPDLDLFPWHEIEPNNIVLSHPKGRLRESCAPSIVEVPEKDRHGYRYLMMYRSKGRGGQEINGIRLIGSQDGIHWDAQSDIRIAHLHSDHHNTICYDPRRSEYVMFCRPKHIYRTFRGPVVDTGASRRVARMSSDKLWTAWLEHTEPQTMLIPDELDNQKHFNFFYGMPTRYHAGVYWGFLEPFRMNDFIHTELAFSRDGVHFQRHPRRGKLIEYGAEGAWDDTMIFASPGWVEVGDEWWIYYSGWDGPHGTTERTGGIGLATIRKEGFVSLRSPAGGGVICTRKIRWAGGHLLVNADADEGELRVRISDAKRKVLAGFDYEDCVPFSGDSVRHRVAWKNGDISDHKGKVIRLEFLMTGVVDLYTFLASNPEIE